MDTPLYRGEIYMSILFSVLQQQIEREKFNLMEQIRVLANNTLPSLTWRCGHLFPLQTPIFT